MNEKLPRLNKGQIAVLRRIADGEDVHPKALPMNHLPALIRLRLVTHDAGKRAYVLTEEGRRFLAS